MRKGTSIAAAVFALSLTAASITPTHAQSSDSSNSTDFQVSSLSSTEQSSDASCVAVGLAAGLPLLLLIPTAVNMPGLEVFEQANSDIQRRIGVFNPELAAAVEENKHLLQGAAGLAAGGMGLAAAFYFVQNCLPGDGSSIIPDPTEPTPEEPTTEEPTTEEPTPEEPTTEEPTPEEPTTEEPTTEEPTPEEPTTEEPTPEEPAPGEIIVDDFVLTRGGTVNIPVAEPGSECTVTGLPSGLTYDATSGAITGSLATLPRDNGGETYDVTITCGDASQSFTLQQHEYFRKPETLVGQFDAFNYRDIVEATFTMDADAAVYDGPAPDGNPIATRTFTVTRSEDGSWSQDISNLYITAYDEARFSVVATDANGNEYTGTGGFGERLYL